MDWEKCPIQKSSQKMFNLKKKSGGDTEWEKHLVLGRMSHQVSMQIEVG
jgi:hypothetical protein